MTLVRLFFEPCITFFTSRMPNLLQSFRKKSMNGFQENYETVILGPKIPYCPKFWENKKSPTTKSINFLHLGCLTHCKVSVKSNEWISRKLWTVILSPKLPYSIAPNFGKILYIRILPEKISISFLQSRISDVKGPNRSVDVFLLISEKYLFW